MASWIHSRVATSGLLHLWRDTMRMPWNSLLTSRKLKV